VTDGSLPVPGATTVDFTGFGTSCIPPAPVAGPGFAISTFSSGYVAQNFFFGNTNWHGCPGASNPAFDSSSNAYVANFRTGDFFKFGLAGGTISNTDKLSNLNPTIGELVFSRDGRLYGTHGATTGDFTTGDVVEIDPSTGAQLRVVTSNVTCPDALAVDPLSGDLFFDDQCFGGGSDNPSLWRVHDPGGAATLSVYATLPATPNGGIAFAPNGTLYVVTGYTGATPTVLAIGGTNTSSPRSMTAVPDLSSIYGLAIVQAKGDGSAKAFLIQDTNGVQLVDITTTPYTKTLLMTGGGTGVVGPDGCLYVGLSDTIYKLSTSAGTCGFVPTSPGPALALAPATVSPSPVQGTTQTLTATFTNIAAPACTAVVFHIIGPNVQTKLATTNANGAATISYVGVLSGHDTISATGTVGATVLTSNTATVDWANGKHVSFVSLDLSPTSGSAGSPVNLKATLADVSVTPSVAISGATIQFSLGGQVCSGVTGSSGVASCAVTPPAGQLTLTATFAGNAQFTAASAAQAFSTFGASAPAVPGAPTIGNALGGNGFVLVAFTPPSSDGGSPILSYLATCQPLSVGATVSGSGTVSPISVAGVMSGVAYTCSVSAINAAGASAPSALSNVVTPSGASSAAVQIPAVDKRNTIVLTLLLMVIGLDTLRRRRSK
jgi:hypothetical protein